MLKDVKVLFGIFGLTIVLIAIAMWFGLKAEQEKTQQMELQNQVEKTESSSTSTGSTFDQRIDFKYLKTITSPFDNSQISFAVTAESGDSNCGGYLSRSDCFLFWNKTPTFKQPLIAVFNSSDIGAVDFDSIKFIDKHDIVFKTFDGDGGGMTYKTWQVNLWTAESKLINFKDYQGN